MRVRGGNGPATVWLGGSRGHGGQQPRPGAWGICQQAPANFSVRGVGTSVLYRAEYVSGDTAPTPPREKPHVSYIHQCCC